MIRLVGMALVIWGLIVQPLMAGIPTKMANDSTNIEVALDFGVAEHVDENQNYHDQNTQATTKPPCHDETADSESYSHSCDNCVNSGMCASSCVLSGVAVNHELMVLSEQQIRTPIFVNSDPFGSWFLSRIYHPPKLS